MLSYANTAEVSRAILPVGCTFAITLPARSTFAEISDERESFS